MKLPRARFNIRWIMAIIAIVAGFFGAFRHEGNSALGLAIFIACIGLLAYRHFTESLARTDRSKRSRAGLLLDSIALALFIILISDMAFLVGFFAYVACMPIRSHQMIWRDPSEFLNGVIAGIMLAMITATALRRKYWEQHDRPRGGPPLEIQPEEWDAAHSSQP